MEINGKPVVNATEPLSIHILPGDISAAKRKDPGACAAARAIVREIDCKQARVHLDRTYVEETDRWIRYRTPGSLRNEIIAIDRGGKFMPGAHELKALPETERARYGKRQGGPTASKRRQAKKIARSVHRIENVREKGANH